MAVRTLDAQTTRRQTTVLPIPEPCLSPVTVDTAQVVEEVNAELAKLAGGISPAIPASPVQPRHDRRFAIKYAVDRVLALLALVVLAPLMLMTALAVRVSSAGPVLFRQLRVGLGGQLFVLYKFRTMVDGPVDPGFVPPEGAAPGGIEGSDRRTPLGRLLRASSADELPQLVNVLRGDMSLIGPRPERPEFARRFAVEVPGYADRHRVKVGITGWAQANGLRGQTSIAARTAYDNHYIDNWSLKLELRALVLTCVEVLRFGRDARLPQKTACGHQRRQVAEQGAAA